ncbi:MAG: hypothetical protein BMS9Abin31_0836 [Gammaproteobacteria bacterium]|nr:MAG: hypothetical protein BMS9Abin31_0836 [Gammaproteobacteria bacterium]
MINLKMWLKNNPSVPFNIPFNKKMWLKNNPSVPFNKVSGIRDGGIKK